MVNKSRKKIKKLPNEGEINATSSTSAATSTDKNKTKKLPETTYKGESKHVPSKPATKSNSTLGASKNSKEVTSPLMAEKVWNSLPSSSTASTSASQKMKGNNIPSKKKAKQSIPTKDVTAPISKTKSDIRSGESSLDVLSETGNNLEDIPLLTSKDAWIGSQVNDDTASLFSANDIKFGSFLSSDGKEQREFDQTNHQSMQHIISNFPSYNDFKIAQILYCQFRVISMFKACNRQEINIKMFCNLFEEMFHENFFTFKVLQHYIRLRNDENLVAFILKFIEDYCSDFLVLKDSVIYMKGNPDECHINLLNLLITALEKINFDGGKSNIVPVRNHNPTPAEMQLLGRGLVESEINVFGRGHALDFQTPNNLKNNYLNGPHRPSMKEIDQRVIQIRKKMCRNGDVVNIANVLLEVCSYYNVSNVCKINPTDRQIRKDTDVSQIMEIVRLQAKVNAFIQAFVTFRNICTLHELETDLCKLESKESFNEFNLGPLQRQLLVFQHFKFPHEKPIPEITTLDVFISLRRFSRKFYSKRDKTADGHDNAKDNHMSMQEFLEDLIENYDFDDPFESGVRMQSFPLAVQVVNKAANLDSRSVRDAIQEFENHLINELQIYLDSSARKLIGTNGFQGMTGDTLVGRIQGMDITQGLTLMCDMIEQIKRGHSQLKKATRKSLFAKYENILDFIDEVKSNAFTKRVFQLLVSTSTMVVLGKDDLDILINMGFLEAAKEIIEAEVRNKKSESKKIATSPKRKVIDLIKSCLEKNKSIQFKTLLNIENYVVSASDNADVISFEDFGHGSFLKFVMNDKDLKNTFEANLETPNGFSSGSSSSSCSKDDVQAFVQQCCGRSLSKENISQSILLQFYLKELSKPLHNLVNQTVGQTEQKIQQEEFSGFVYLHALVCGNELQNNTLEDANENRFHDLAVKKIKSCPPLVSIGEWTDWDLMFQQKVGNLKSFLTKLMKVKEFDAYFFLENKPNVFVKVSKTKTMDNLLEGLKNLNDIEVTESLISIICTYGSVENSPIALLSNYIKSTFLQKTRDVVVNNEDPRKSKLLQFCLQCFRLVPFELLLCVIEKLFLSQLVEVYGTSNVPKLLLEACDISTRNILHGLGFRLSINEWIQDYEENLNKTEDMEEAEANVHMDDEKLSEEEQAGTSTNETDTTCTTAESDLVAEDVSDELVNDEKINDDAIKEDIDDEKEEVSKNLAEHDDLVSLAEEGTNNNRSKYCEEFIEGIRLEQFAVGCEAELSEVGKKVLNIYREREGRSLHRLSKELYTKDSHFVLELIQNADDNEYFEENMKCDASEKPTVAFIVEKDKVTVLNNEKGFADKNIKALCDVGKSTKGIHRKGYIGQKGIGFKSVFRVTDAPEIHSNGFHIKFDASKGPNGYILPEWLGDTYEQHSLSMKQDEMQFSWRTEIILPLKEEMQMEKLTSRFHDIDPSLLMFLNRLHTIIIDDRVTNTVKIMSKEVVGENLIELRENGKASLWFTVSKDIPIDVRTDVTTTSISVAFPISDKKDAKNVLLPQKVFAFLPLRSYGFKFIIQADFEVPSSREDIDKDSAWNQYILQEIPSLVLDAFHSFKVHSHFSGMDGLIEFFKFMDLEEHILGIFKQVQGNVIKKLQQEECLPIHCEADNKTPVNKADILASEDNKSVKWALPSSIIMSKMEHKIIVTPTMLKEYLNLNYIHAKLQNNKHISATILKALGVNLLSQDQLIEILKAIIAGIDDSDDDDDDSTNSIHSWIGKWMLVVSAVLQEQCDLSEDTRAKLQSLKMIPVSDGSLVSLSETVVFFPVVNSKLQSNTVSKSLQLIESDLSILSRSLTFNLEELEEQQVKRLLKDLGIKSMTPSELINDHIIPCFRNGKWQEKTKEMRIAYVQYLFEQYHLNNNLFEFDDIKDCIVLKTNKGFIQPLQSFIYFTKSYGNEIDLEKKFPACDWTLISSSYMSVGTVTSTSQRKWQEFFSKLGLRHFTCLREEKKELHLSDLSESPWKSSSQTWQKTKDDTYIIQDLICPEFSALLKSGDHEQMNSFAVTLDDQWEKSFQDYGITRPKCKVLDTDGNVLQLTYSSFYTELRFSPWMLSTMSNSCIPKGLYMNLECIFNYMGDKVNYLKSPIKNKDFIQTLGLQTELKFVDFLTEFKKWRTEASFVTSWQHVVHIYNYIHVKFQDAETRDDLLKNPFIFLPLKHSPNGRITTNCMAIEGRFYLIDHVCWEDPSGLIMAETGVSQRRIMGDCYYKLESSLSLKHFFLKEIGVERFPQVREYLNVVRSIAEKTPLPNRIACRKILQLFAVLGARCIRHDQKEELSKWRFEEALEDNLYFYGDIQSYFDKEEGDLVREAVKEYPMIFPTHGNRFTGIADMATTPIVVFNNGKSEVFESEKKVELIKIDAIRSILDKNEQNDRNHWKYRGGSDLDLLKILFFFKACGLKTLTEVAMPPETTPEFIEVGCRTWETYLHEAVPYVQRYIIQKYSGLYKRLVEGNFLSYLEKSKFYSAHRFEIVHRLEGRRDVNIAKTSIAYVEHGERSEKATIYVIKASADDKDKYDDILRSLMNIFVHNNSEEIIDDLFDFTSSLFIESDKDRFMTKRKRIPALKDGESPWSFPKPPPLYVPPPVEEEEEIIEEESPKIPVTVNGDGERRMTCWPPRDPGRTGMIPKPDSVKKQEEDILAKWHLPEAPDNAVPNATEVRSKSQMPFVSPRPNSESSSGAEFVSPSGLSQMAVSPCASVGISPQHQQHQQQVTSPLPPGEQHEQKQSSDNVEQRPSNNQQTPRTEDQQSNRDINMLPMDSPTKAPIPGYVNSPARSAHGGSTHDSDSGVEGGRANDGNTEKGPLDLENLSTYNLVEEYQAIQFSIGVELEQRINTFNETVHKEISNRDHARDSINLIGKIGEEIVYQHFLSVYKDQIASGSVEVKWMNAEQETGEPYDFKITTHVLVKNKISGGRKKKSAVVNTTVKEEHEFIEVKTTYMNEEKEFEISSQQLKFAFRHGQRFHLYRVSGLATQTERKLRCLKNLSSFMDKKAVKLYMVL